MTITRREIEMWIVICLFVFYLGNHNRPHGLLTGYPRYFNNVQHNWGKAICRGIQRVWNVWLGVVRCVLFEGSLKLNWSHRSERAIDWIHRDVRSNLKSYRLAIETRCRDCRMGAVGVQGGALTMARRPFLLAWNKRSLPDVERL